MTTFGAPEIVQSTDERYFLVKDEQGRHCIAYKADNGELCIKSSIYSDLEFISKLNIFIVTDFETDSCGLIDTHGEELVPCFFQTVVITKGRIVLVDYNNKAHDIYIEEGKSVKKVLLRYTKSLRAKDVFMMGKSAGFRDAQKPR
ncbi:MAG TPA: hypothetical protein VEG39_01890 [Clostridia bacterium]|nr:hypothetical protein [Clostridia bacterium]